VNHSCTTLLLRCIDYRLEAEIEAFLNQRGLVGACDLVSLAGAAKTLPTRNFPPLEKSSCGKSSSQSRSMASEGWYS
jgi:hypothetical protein